MHADRPVHVIDDDEAVRESLLFLFDSAGLRAEAYASPLAFLDALDADAAGCVVTDVRMPGMNGLELLRRLQERARRLPVIVITGHGDVPLAVEAMKSGAFDFLEKPFDDEIFLTTVRDALARSARGAPPRAAAADGLDGKLALLSERERQVLDRLIEGEANKVIAQHLGISPRTVEIYRAKVMTKMEAASFADLIRTVVAGRGG